MRMMTTYHLLRTLVGGSRQRSPKQRKRRDVTSSNEIDKVCLSLDFLFR